MTPNKPTQSFLRWLEQTSTKNRTLKDISWMAWTEGQKEMSNQILPILLEVSDQINLLRLNSIHDFEEVIIKLAKATARTQWTK